MSATVAFRDERVALPTGELQDFRSGTGSTLVALHSSGGESLTPALEELATDFDVVVPMLPGFGESNGLEHVDSIEDAVFVLLDLWDALGLASPVVMGLSLGGWLTLELATRHPERLAAMVLVNSAGLHLPEAPMAELFGRSPNELAEMLFVDQEQPLAAAMHEMGDFTGDVGKLVDVPLEVVLPYWQALGATAKLAWDPYFHNPKLRGRLRRADVPALVVCGVQDGLIPPAHSEVLAAELPSARLERVEGAAHWLPFERGPELAALVRDFVAGGTEREGSAGLGS